jgi:DNA mismatch endonuclease (patch repair protein)
MSTWPGNAKLQQTSFGRLTRAELMARVRSKGNKTTEERLAMLLRREGITGWRRHQKLPGRPDFIWKKVKLAVFVDGCFWHGHACRNIAPKRNALLWRDKVAKNKIRDRQSNKRLRSNGWTVVRIWECQLRNKPNKYLSLVRKQLKMNPAR